ncbi:EAL domain-containing protein [Roseibium denhamense]|nr:EAL domain-containing protein [Roseibium denhamense]
MGERNGDNPRRGKLAKPLFGRMKKPLSNNLMALTDGGSLIERPLRIAFLSFLTLTIVLLTGYNIVTQYRHIHQPPKQIERTITSLLAQQKALGRAALADATSAIAADLELQDAVRIGNHEKVRLIADAIFAQRAKGLGISQLTIYSADRSFAYHAHAPSHIEDPRVSFQSDLAASLYQTPDSIALGENNEVVVSLLEPWTASGRLLGYLKLSINIEPALRLVSEALDAEVVAVTTAKADGPASADDEGAIHAQIRPMGAGAASDAGFSGADFDAAAASSLLEAQDGRIFRTDGKIFLAQDLDVSILSSAATSKLVLLQDITGTIGSFIRSSILSLLAGVALAGVFWLLFRRLVDMLQASILTTHSQLENAVHKSTVKLENTARRLIEAQHVASIGSWERNLGTKEIVASDEFYRILGLPDDTPPTKIRGRMLALIPEAQRQAALDAARASVQKTGGFDFEQSIIREDGSIRYLHFRGHMVEDPAGGPSIEVGTVHDITDRRQAERKKDLLAEILESSLNEIYILDAKTFGIEYANSSALENLGYRLNELKSQCIWDINQVYQKETVERHVMPLLDGRVANLTVESSHRRKDGTIYPVDLQVQLFRDHDKDLFVVMANDVTERVQRENETREAKNRAERLAYFDSLTKLFNRAGCQRDAKEWFAGSNKPSFLVHVDMDNFKKVNDTLGHLAGDYCLEETGRRLREVCRGLGTPYRWGGDEFVILANRFDADPNELCERARRLMRMPMEFNGNRFWPTVSMGIALCPDDGTDFDTLLTHADLALYQSKEKGKDRFTFFTRDMKTVSDDEAMVERELLRAIEQDQFFLVYQPQVSLRGQNVTGVEALVRWRHPDRGILSPAQFLPIVEKTNLAPVLGNIVIDKALAAARSWLDAGVDFGRISINVSPSHLASGSLLDHFTLAMNKHNIGADYITAEVLESVFLDEEGASHLSTLDALYRLGVHIELDDFGTGYASLSHVTSLKINGLKIDRSFTKQMLADPKKEAVVNHLVHLARSLDIKIVCEGVETDAQYQRLRMMGDFSIQGYLIARPMPFEQMNDWFCSTTQDVHFVV